MLATNWKPPASLSPWDGDAVPEGCHLPYAKCPTSSQKLGAMTFLGESCPPVPLHPHQSFSPCILSVCTVTCPGDCRNSSVYVQHMQLQGRAHTFAQPLARWVLVLRLNTRLPARAAVGYTGGEALPRRHDCPPSPRTPTPPPKAHENPWGWTNGPEQGHYLQLQEGSGHRQLLLCPAPLSSPGRCCRDMPCSHAGAGGLGRSRMGS